MGTQPKEEKAAGLTPMTVGNRVLSAVDVGKALAVCEEVAKGEKSLKDICQMPGMPPYSTFQRWKMLYPDVMKAYTTARELSAHAFEDEALDMARKLRNQTDFNGTQVRAYEVAMGQYRWSAARRDPASYAERGAGTIVIPVQINTSLDLGQPGGGAAQKTEDVYSFASRIASKEDPEVIEATPVEAEVDLNETTGAYGLTLKPKSILETKPIVRGTRPKKGHKTPEATRKTITNYNRRGKTNGSIKRAEPVRGNTEPNT